MKNKLLPALVVMMLFGFTLPVTTQTDTPPPAPCDLDLTDMITALQSAQVQIDADETTDALSQIAAIRDDLQVLLMRCADATEPDVVMLDETAVLRRVLPEGDIIVRFPVDWQSEIAEDWIAFGNSRDAVAAGMPEADHIAGALTGFTRADLRNMGFSASYTVADVVEGLALRFAEGMDDAMLSDADLFDADGRNAAIVTGQFTEDDLTGYTAFVAVDLDEQFAFLFVTAFDESTDVVGISQAMANGLEYAPDE